MEVFFRENNATSHQRTVLEIQHRAVHDILNRNQATNAEKWWRRNNYCGLKLIIFCSIQVVGTIVILPIIFASS